MAAEGPQRLGVAPPGVDEYPAAVTTEIRVFVDGVLHRTFEFEVERQ